MSYDVAVNIALPAHLAGTPLEAIILDPSGQSITRTTGGFLELGAGFWVWRYSFATGFTGEVLFQHHLTGVLLTSTVVADETPATDTQTLSALLQASEARIIQAINARCSGGTGHVAAQLKTMPAVLLGRLTTHAPAHPRTLHGMPLARSRQVQGVLRTLTRAPHAVPVALTRSLTTPRLKAK